MNRTGHILTFLAYLLVAIIVGSGLIPVPASLMAVPGTFLCLIIVAIGLSAHGLITAIATERRVAGENARIAQEFAAMAVEQRRIEGEINHLSTAIFDLKSEPKENVGRVVEEVKVLQSLIGRLYDARKGGTADMSPAAAPPQTAKAPSQATASSAVQAKEPDQAEKTEAPVDLDDDQILELVREGLRENGVELALQPIVSLPQRKRRHFECFSRIRLRDGRVITPELYIEIAERNGLIAAIDNLILLRCLQTLRRIRKGNVSVSFFLNISPHTLADRAFFREFIGLMTQNADLATALVFELPQRGLYDADPNLERDLERLAQMGFRFSLDQVADLDLDLEALANAHFRFLKLDAQRLLRASRDGLLGGDAKEFKRQLDIHGIDLIVERIETEPTLLELLDLHIDYGQGYLFGEPRLAKVDPNPANA